MAARTESVCYTPRHAKTARQVFAGRTRRYVVTSAVEVYEYTVAPAAEGVMDPHGSRRPQPPLGRPGVPRRA